MFSAFLLGPAASRRGLCDIDRVLFRVSKSRVRKLGSPSTTKIYQLQLKLKEVNYRYILVALGLPNRYHHTVRIRWLPDLYEMPKSWNPPYYRFGTI